MGFFSWNCKGCGHPLLGPMATEDLNGWMTDGVVILEDGTILKGEYDGYGRLDNRDINEVSECGGEPECWHHSCWIKAGKPTKWATGSEGSEDQGWFFSNGVHNIPDPLKT